MKTKIYFISHDNSSFNYEIHFTENGEIFTWGNFKYAKFNKSWLPELSESLFALTEEEIYEKLKLLVKEDLEFVEQQYKTNKKHLEGLLVNKLKITEL